MKVLVISNFYPPHNIGGYELGCRDVVDCLRSRGHEVSVLTSVYGVEQPAVQGHIRRTLSVEPFGPGWMPRRVLAKPSVYLRNRELAQQAMQELRPDVVYLWNPALISLAPAFAAADFGIPVAYFVSDAWMMNWEKWPAEAVRRWAQPLLALSLGARSIRSLDLRATHFASDYLRTATADAGRDVATGRVIHWGVDPARFPYRPRERGPTIRLLYVGQLAPHKGVHTAIEAVRLLVERHGLTDVELSLAGASIYPAYERKLRQLVQAPALTERVRFLGHVAREQTSELHADHDIFVFPSMWKEPFSLSLLEAMASGTAIVGTDTGGTAEVLRHEETGLVFGAGDAHACARGMQRLIQDAELARRLSTRARALVQERFTLDSMIDRVEVGLKEAATAGAAA